MFNILNVVWYKCNFKSYGQSILKKLPEPKIMEGKEEFEKTYGKVVFERCDFDGAYNEIISDAYNSIVPPCIEFDGDFEFEEELSFFITEDGTFWVKYNTHHGLKWYLCALLIGYVMSQVCKQEQYENIKKLGMFYSIYCVQVFNVSDITDKVWNNVCQDLVGYFPVKDKSLWRESKGTNQYKLSILWDFYKKWDVPSNIKHPKIANEIVPIENELHPFALSKVSKNEIAIPMNEHCFSQIWMTQKLFYISDIHLDHPKKISKDISWKKQLRIVCKELVKSIGFGSPIIIAGDTANTIETSRMFYHALRIAFAFHIKEKDKPFVRVAMNEQEANDEYEIKKRQIAKSFEEAEKRFCQAKVFFFGKRKKIEKIIEESYQHEGEEKYDVIIREYEKMESLKRKLESFISNKEEFTSKLQRSEKFSFLMPTIFVILGNHELSEFNTVEEAVFAYRDMLSKEGISLLHNEIFFGGDYILLGGPGFAKFNQRYNTITLVGARTMGRKEEIAQSERFYKVYEEALCKAKEKDVPLIVASHYPAKDWLPKKEYDSYCYYLYGHNHNNYFCQEGGVNIFADNQIGYKNNKIQFKCGEIGTLRNPFFDCKDGCYTITTNLYVRFMKYKGKTLHGISPIEKALQQEGSNFCMVKAFGYYGFFVITDNEDAKLCYGGKVFVIKGTKGKDIHYFFEAFLLMVSIQMEGFASYYKFLRDISSELKSIGLDGRIHGSIVDIDFYHHISVNLEDGEITLYYSPIWGVVKKYESFEAMLEDSLKYTLGKERYLNVCQKYEEAKRGKNMLLSLGTIESSDVSTLQVVSINEGMYAVSNRMNRIQSLFDIGILGVWNENIIHMREKKENVAFTNMEESQGGRRRNYAKESER